MVAQIVLHVCHASALLAVCVARLGSTQNPRLGDFSNSRGVEVFELTKFARFVIRISRSVKILALP